MPSVVLCSSPETSAMSPAPSTTLQCPVNLHVDVAGLDSSTHFSPPSFHVSGEALSAYSLPRVIICCGLPGSGKTWFTRLLSEYRGYIRVCEDEIGSPVACTEAYLAALSSSAPVVVDACNPTAAERNTWLSLALHPSHALCVHFSADAGTCRQRAAEKLGPLASLPSMKAGLEYAILDFQQRFEVPNLAVEKFSSVLTIPTFKAAQDFLLACLGATPLHTCPTSLFCPSTFPCTPINTTSTSARACASIFSPDSPTPLHFTPLTPHQVSQARPFRLGMPSPTADFRGSGNAIQLNSPVVVDTPKSFVGVPARSFGRFRGSSSETSPSNDLSPRSRPCSPWSPAGGSPGKERSLLRCATENDRAASPSSSGPQVKQLLVKFPKTPHLFAPSGTPADGDLVLTEYDKIPFLEPSKKECLTLEEKVDGVNLGISVDAQGNFLLQSRSQYINPRCHPQFASLDGWLRQHRADLLQVLLRSGAGRPQRYVLFGEWLGATHSIRYTKLPDKFLVYDMYDSKHNKFFSRERVQEGLEGTALYSVPCITTYSLPLRESSVLDLSSTLSLYYNGPVEGVYFRLDKGEWNFRRAKVLRKYMVVGRS